MQTAQETFWDAVRVSTYATHDPLTERELDILLRVRRFGQTQTEAAAELGLSQGAVSKSLARSERKLEPFLKRAFGDGILPDASERRRCVRCEAFLSRYNPVPTTSPHRGGLEAGAVPGSAGDLLGGTSGSGGAVDLRGRS